MHKNFHIYPLFAGLIISPLSHFPDKNLSQTPYDKKNSTISVPMSPYIHGFYEQNKELNKQDSMFNYDTYLIPISPREKIKNIKSIEDGEVAKAAKVIRYYKDMNKAKTYEINPRIYGNAPEPKSDGLGAPYAPPTY